MSATPRLVLALAGLVLFAAAPARAQFPAGGPPGGMGGGPATALTGRVLDDATGEGIPSATVALFTDGTFVTGTAADVDGLFSLERIPPATYEVRFSAVGYAEIRRPGVEVRPGAPTELGEIRLAVSTVELDETEVTARRELVEQRADRTVYNVADQPITAAGSAIETLQTLPSIEVDASGGISLRGNQNVVIQINGRPVPVRGAFLTALLRQIPASTVERVEVIPNPSARYDPDGMSGIINIVLRENTDRGLSGGFTLGGGTAPNGEVGANVAYQRGAVDVTATYGYRYDSFASLGSSDRRNLALGDFTTQASEDDNGSQSHFLNTTFDYLLAQGTNLTLEGNFGVRSGSNSSFVNSLVTPGAGTASENERLTDGSNDGLNGDLALVFRRRFDGQNAGAPAGGGNRGGRGGMGGPGGGGPMMMGGRGGGGGAGLSGGEHELALEARVTRNDGSDEDLFIQRQLDPAGTDVRERSATDETNDTGYLQLDYARPLAGLRLEAGAKTQWEHVSSALLYERETDGVFVSLPGRTNDFDFTQGIYAAYLQGSRSLGPFEAQVGVRAETATREFTLNTPLPPVQGLPSVDPDSTRLSYSSLFPSAFLTYPMGPGSLIKASYSRRIERPRTWALTPFPSFEDTLNVRVGNPLLRPEYTDAYELTLQYKYFLTLTPFYRHTSDVIRRRFFYDPVTNVSTVTQQNLDTQDSYGADLTVMAALGRFRGFVSGSMARTVTDGESVEVGLASDAMTYSLRGSLQVNVRPGTDVQLFGFWRAPQNVEDGRISAFSFTTLGINQKISDRLSLALRVNDLFSTTRFEFRTTDGDTFELSGIRDPNIQQVSGTLTYTFGRAPQRRARTPQAPTGTEDVGF